MSLISIDIATEFKGKKAFDQAGKSVSGLDKAVNKLGKQIAGVFAVSQVTRFAKASVNAFLEAEKANVRLANAVNNLGLSFAQAGIQKNLDDISAKAGIAGELLVDAFQPLLTTTGSVIKSQELLALALDVSAGSGKDIVEVSKDLSLAYTGVTRGLRKYNLGLTQAELKAADFNKIQGLLNKQFSGAQSKYLATYAGQMQILTEAAGNAQEIIGTGLVDALTILAGKDASIQSVADSMASVAEEIGNITRGLALMIKQVTSIPVLSGVFSALASTIAATPLGLLLGQASKMGAKKTAPAGFSFFGSPMEEQKRKQEAAAAKKIEADAAKRAAALLKAQKGNTAELKRQALTKKQSALFDLEQIQLVAALQGKLSKEEQDRVKLQLALLTGNTTEADKLSQKIAMTIDSTGELAAYLKTLPDAKNPFLGWDEWLKTFTKNLATVTGSTIPTTGGGVSPAPITTVPSSNALPANVFNTLGSANASTRTADEARRLYGGMGSSQPIVIQIDGREIASVVQNQGLQGNNPIINRLGSFS
jgi:hypothetical protein